MVGGDPSNSIRGAILLGVAPAVPPGITRAIQMRSRPRRSTRPGGSCVSQMDLDQAHGRAMPCAIVTRATVAKSMTQAAELPKATANIHPPWAS